MVHMTKEAYNAYVQQKAKKSPLFKNMLLAFVVGGLICMLGQGLKQLYLYLGAEESIVGTLVSISLIFLAALFTGLTLYDRLARYAGAGTLVPITGFANAVVAPALEFRREGLILGLSSKLFTIAGAVLLFGISASVLYGVIVFIFGL